MMNKEIPYSPLTTHHSPSFHLFLHLSCNNTNLIIMIHFDLPKEKSSIIKVIGIGGGGSNAVNHMNEQNIEGVNFIICNTDAQAIATSRVPNKVQLGPHLTQG